MSFQDQPGDTDNWLSSLQSMGVDEVCDKDLGHALRVIAGMQQDAVCLCSGPATLPYINWLRDGLKMSSRMIIHLDPAHESLGPAVQTQLERDIRIAGHFQDIESFSADIARHRVDLLVAAVDEANRAAMDGLIALLNDCALFVGIADAQMQERLWKDYADDYFLAPLGSGQRALMLTRKGRQHRLSRRGGRRKKTR